MACSEHQTSTILDCICINGETLIEYVDGGDQTLQALITAMQATLTTLQACCTSNTAAIETINGLIPLLQAELAALQTCCNTNTAAIATLQSLVNTLQETVITLQTSVAEMAAQVHPRLTLTKVQDITNRATLDVVGSPLGQVLNLPPAIAGRILGTGLSAPGGLPVGLNTPTLITGLLHDYDTVSGTMAQTNHLVIPRGGRYNISGSWGGDAGPGGLPVCPAYTLGAVLGINGVWFGRYTAPNNPLADQVAFTLPGQRLTAGDILTLGGYSDCAGVVATSAYLAAEYIEGT